MHRYVSFWGSYFSEPECKPEHAESLQFAARMTRSRISDGHAEDLRLSLRVKEGRGEFWGGKSHSVRGQKTSEGGVLGRMFGPPINSNWHLTGKWPLEENTDPPTTLPGARLVGGRVSDSVPLQEETPPSTHPQGSRFRLSLCTLRTAVRVLDLLARLQSASVHIRSPFFPGIQIFLENLQKPREHGWLLKRSMVEQNGNGIKP